MRPLQLSIQYFGSYTEKQTIDFDKLGKKGLYLITGDTGSGKTTIFDAIKYALYGEMSGGYRQDNTLRSSLAKDTDKTEVYLKFEKAGKEYEVRRWMSYLGPDRRSKTEEKFTEQKGGAELKGYNIETPITNKNATSKIEEILGIDSKQFSQIAMIAQGDFMKLLMADTKERLELFRKIFKTEKYQTLQDLVSKEFSNAEKDKNETRIKIQTIVKSAKSADDSELKPELVQAQDEKEFTPIEKIIEIIQKILDEDKDRKEQLDKLKEEQEGIIRECEANIKMIKSHDDARTQLPEKEKKLKILEEENLPAQENALKEAKSKEGDITTLRTQAAQIEGGLGDYKALDEARGNLSSAENTLKGIEGENGKAAKNAKAIEDLDRKEQELRTEKQKLGNPEADLQKIQGELGKLKDALKDVDDLKNKRKELKSAQSEFEGAQKKANQAWDDFRAKRDLFYMAQAGILAETLEDNKPCPVCGSTHHPHKAQKASEVPSKEELDILEGKAKNCDEDVKKKSSKCGELNGQISALEDKLKGVKWSAEELPGKIQEYGYKEEKLNKYKKRLAQINTELEINIPNERKRLNEVTTQINSAKTKAIADRNNAQTLIDNLKKKCKFENKQAAELEIQRLRNEADGYENAITQANNAVQGTIKDIAALKGEIGGLQEILKTTLSLDEEKEQARKTAAENEIRDNIQPLIEAIIGRNSSNSTAIEKLREKEKSIEVIEKRYQWLKTLDDTMSGKLSGKEKIKLETYIQAAYFEKIIQKANLRLLKMTNNQYELRRQITAANKNQQVGLDLDVIDHHNGKTRTVKSLSGGESFMASLSLALGLSDEVQSSAGGIELDAMFVDEGFGSLDEETLKQARNTLQKLSQEGNRLIGIISHVAELKNIEKQIQVKKNTNGESCAKVVIL